MVIAFTPPFPGRKRKLQSPIKSKICPREVEMTHLEEIDYQRITDSLTTSELYPSAAEVQGVFCGLLCAGDPEPEETWLSELLPTTPPEDLLVQEARRPLLTLAAGTREQLESDGPGLSLLLPSDELPLAERATAVYDWSRGFLFGLALAGLRESDLSEDVRAVFGDFAALTRMDLDDLDDSEDNEQALMEVVEFIRVAAMLIYEERTRVGKEAGPRGS